MSECNSTPWINGILLISTGITFLFSGLTAVAVGAEDLLAFVQTFKGEGGVTGAIVLYAERAALVQRMLNTNTLAIC